MPFRSSVKAHPARALVWSFALLLPVRAFAQQPSPAPPSPAPDLEKRVRELEETVRQMQADQTRRAVIPGAEQISSTPSPSEPWTAAPVGDVGGVGRSVRVLAGTDGTEGWVSSNV